MNIKRVFFLLKVMAGLNYSDLYVGNGISSLWLFGGENKQEIFRRHDTQFRSREKKLKACMKTLISSIQYRGIKHSTTLKCRKKSFHNWKGCSQNVKLWHSCDIISNLLTNSPFEALWTIWLCLRTFTTFSKQDVIFHKPITFSIFPYWKLKKQLSEAYSFI